MDIAKKKKYELINEEGCFFDSVEESSFVNARKYFAGKYSGKFIILCGEGKRQNIILK